MGKKKNDREEGRKEGWKEEMITRVIYFHDMLLTCGEVGMLFVQHSQVVGSLLQIPFEDSVFLIHWKYM